MSQKLVESELKKELRSEDAPDTLRLVLHDAGTYDVATETGGINGSIRFRSGTHVAYHQDCFWITVYAIHTSTKHWKQVEAFCYSEELNRPENKSLLPLVDRLKKVKTMIDQKTTTAGN